jgi:hypothetical protein
MKGAALDHLQSEAERTDTLYSEAERTDTLYILTMLKRLR